MLLFIKNLEVIRTSARYRSNLQISEIAKVLHSMQGLNCQGLQSLRVIQLGPLGT